MKSIKTHKNVEMNIKKTFYKFLVSIVGISAPYYPLNDTFSKIYLILKFLCKKFTSELYLRTLPTTVMLSVVVRAIRSNFVQ